MLTENTGTQQAALAVNGQLEPPHQVVLLDTQVVVVCGIFLQVTGPFG